MSMNQFRLGNQGDAQRALVLGVDDDEDNLLLLSYALDCLDCDFIGETSGQAALLATKTHRPNLILMDVLLSDANGIELVQELKRDPHLAQVPVIAVTGLAAAENQAELLAAGFIDYISKPYLIDELEAKVRQHLCLPACL
ncbi:MAG: response regulator [Synechococcales cyanobacterium C42_A2020_086]|nr:response regulator [Synechococcales cyanobacterium C42_A2020_086]